MDLQFGQIEIIDHRFCTEVRKGVRTSKGDRALWPLSLTEDEKQLAGFEPTDFYVVELGPRDFAGNHFHTKKQEIMIPLDSLVLMFADPQMPNVVEELYVPVKFKTPISLFYFKQGIAHTVFNPHDLKTAKILVLTNTAEPDIIDHCFADQLLEKYYL